MIDLQAPNINGSNDHDRLNQVVNYIDLLHRQIELGAFDAKTSTEGFSQTDSGIYAPKKYVDELYVKKNQGTAYQDQILRVGSDGVLALTNDYIKKNQGEEYEGQILQVDGDGLLSLVDMPTPTSLGVARVIIADDNSLVSFYTPSEIYNMWNDGHELIYPYFAFNECDVESYDSANNTITLSIIDNENFNYRLIRVNGDKSITLLKRARLYVNYTVAGVLLIQGNIKLIKTSTRGKYIQIFHGKVEPRNMGNYSITCPLLSSVLDESTENVCAFNFRTVVPAIIGSHYADVSGTLSAKEGLSGSGYSTFAVNNISGAGGLYCEANIFAIGEKGEWVFEN